MTYFAFSFSTVVIGSTTFLGVSGGDAAVSNDTTGGLAGSAFFGSSDAAVAVFFAGIKNDTGSGSSTFFLPSSTTTLFPVPLIPGGTASDCSSANRFDCASACCHWVISFATLCPSNCCCCSRFLASYFRCFFIALLDLGMLLPSFEGTNAKLPIPEDFCVPASLRAISLYVRPPRSLLLPSSSFATFAIALLPPVTRGFGLKLFNPPLFVPSSGIVFNHPSTSLKLCTPPSPPCPSGAKPLNQNILLVVQRLLEDVTNIARDARLPAVSDDFDVF